MKMLELANFFTEYIWNGSKNLQLKQKSILISSFQDISPSSRYMHKNVFFKTLSISHGHFSTSISKPMPNSGSGSQGVSYRAAVARLLSVVFDLDFFSRKR